VLYVAAMNKFCQSCTKHPEKPHECFKNFEGPSTGMEKKGIIEGIKYLLQEHQAIVAVVEKDGDMTLEKELKRL
jgi:hypothetical protein